MQREDVDALCRSKALRLPQIQRLMDLLQRKRQLEEAIQTSMHDLEKSYMLAADQLSLCVRVRVDALKG